MAKISIIMPVYNGSEYIASALRSVLEQSFSDFELLVIDDGSTDTTAEIVQSFPDTRIRYIRRPHDYIASLNYGLDIADSPYIARMDADDLMHPDRLRIQYAIMEQEPGIDICATWFSVFRGKDTKQQRLISIHKGVVQNPVLTLLGKNILCHPSVVMRRSFLNKYQLRYEPDFCYAEDYRLWMEAAKCGAMIYVEPSSLLYYRLSDGQICETQKDRQRIAAHRIKEETVVWLLNRIKDAGLLQDYYAKLQQLEQGSYIDFDLKMALVLSVLNHNKHLITT